MKDISLKIKSNSVAIIIALVLVLLLVLIYNSYSNHIISDEIFEGLWIANEEFCQKSQIDGMMLYIGPSQSTWDPRCYERKAYLLMYANDSIVANKTMLITTQGSFLNKVSPFVNHKIYRKIYLRDLNSDISDQIEEEIDDTSMINLKKIMPLIQYLELDLAGGKMTWTGEDEIVYLEAYKDNLSSKYGKQE